MTAPQATPTRTEQQQGDDTMTLNVAEVREMLERLPATLPARVEIGRKSYPLESIRRYQGSILLRADMRGSHTIQSVLEHALGYLLVSERAARDTLETVPANTQDSGYAADRRDAQEILDLITEIRACLRGNATPLEEERVDHRTITELAIELTDAEWTVTTIAMNGASGEQRPWADIATGPYFTATFAARALREALREQPAAETTETILTALTKIERGLAQKAVA